MPKPGENGSGRISSVPKSKSGAKKAARRREKKAVSPARADPPQADIPPLDKPIAEPPDNLRARETAFKRRHGVKG
jgi:hypothetical protein